MGVGDAGLSRGKASRLPPRRAARQDEEPGRRGAAAHPAGDRKDNRGLTGYRALPGARDWQFTGQATRGAGNSGAWHRSSRIVTSFQQRPFWFPPLPETISRERFRRPGEPVTAWAGGVAGRAGPGGARRRGGRRR